jgi:hypothetical protein
MAAVPHTFPAGYSKQKGLSNTFGFEQANKNRVEKKLIYASSTDTQSQKNMESSRFLFLSSVTTTSW